eukprot:m.1487216 g.1487216  ORF g.1487216 m.1487216 type:complete len:70 (-) comp25185_c1_seq7:5061-5270(-)
MTALKHPGHPYVWKGSVSICVFAGSWMHMPHLLCHIVSTGITILHIANVGVSAEQRRCQGGVPQGTRSI